MSPVDTMLDDLIRREGGFTDNPKDKAHQKRRAKGDKWDSYCTNRGITQETLSDWIGRQATVDEVKALTEPDARVIYRERYFVDPRIYDLPEPWQPLVVDWGVNSGPETAIKALQRLCAESGLGIDPGPIDGVIGPKTIAAAKAYLNAPLKEYLAKRREFYQDIVNSNSSQKEFLAGWNARVDDLERGLA